MHRAAARTVEQNVIDEKRREERVASKLLGVGRSSTGLTLAEVVGWRAITWQGGQWSITRRCGLRRARSRIGRRQTRRTPQPTETLHTSLHRFAHTLWPATSGRSAVGLGHRLGSRRRGWTGLAGTVGSTHHRSNSARRCASAAPSASTAGASSHFACPAALPGTENVQPPASKWPPQWRAATPSIATSLPYLQASAIAAWTPWAPLDSSVGCIRGNVGFMITTAKASTNRKHAFQTSVPCPSSVIVALIADR